MTVRLIGNPVVGKREEVFKTEYNLSRGGGPQGKHHIRGMVTKDIQYEGILEKFLKCRGLSYIS